jgi:hypothetical protein
MGSFSDYAELKILEHAVGKTSWTMPTVYLALLTDTPTDASTGSTIVEPTTGGYARIATSGKWDTASAGSISNSSIITSATATGDWGTITHVALVDNTSGGNVIAWGALNTAQEVLNGGSASFAVGALTVTLD